MKPFALFMVWRRTCREGPEKDRWQCENWLRMLLSSSVQLQGLWAESTATGYVFMLGGLAAAAAPSQVISITTGDHGSR